MQKILPGVTQKLFWNEGAEELITSTIVEDIKKCVEQAIVDGHTDNVVIKSAKFPSNLELSTARASVVGWFIIEKIRLPPVKMVVAQYVKLRPLIESTIDDSCASNRRVKNKILKAIEVVKEKDQKVKVKAADQKTRTIPDPKLADQA